MRRKKHMTGREPHGRDRQCGRKETKMGGEMPKLRSKRETKGELEINEWQKLDGKIEL